MSNLAIYVNDSQVYLDKKIKETAEIWGYPLTNSRKIEEWVPGSASIVSLFGIKTFVILDLTEDRNLKKFKQLIDSDKKGQTFVDDWFGNGVIIISKKATGKWLEKFAEKFNATFEKKLDIKTAKENLLKELGLSRQLTEIVSSFVGENYQDLILVQESLKNIDKKKLTVEELYTYLPYKKGTVPPWACVSAFMELNVAKMSTEYWRTIENNHPLVILALIKNKIRNLLIYKSLTLNGFSENEITAVLNFKNTYALKDYRHIRANLATIEVCINYILDTENELKGGGRTDTYYRVEELMTRLTYLLKGG